jgi:flagellar hook protein FlgE
MMKGMYAAVSGLQAHQTMLDVTANNIANVDTIGYKGQRTTFMDELSQTMRGASGPTAGNGGSGAIQVGLGVQIGSIDNVMSTGSLQSTGNPLDIAIQGDGFFRVGAGTPPTTAPYTTGLPKPEQYTRAGNFRLDATGFLTTSTGQYVVGRNAVSAGTGASTTYTPGSTDTYINVPPGSTDVSIGQDGAVSYVDQLSTSPTFGQRVTAGYLSLATFPNSAGLERDGGSLWSATPDSGAATATTPGNNGTGATIGGALEMSNVDLATEFTNMITAERGYDANSRVITTADQMLQTVTQMGQ